MSPPACFQGVLFGHAVSDVRPAERKRDVAWHYLSCVCHGWGFSSSCMHKDRRVLSHLVPADAEYGMFLRGRPVFVHTVAQPWAFRRLRNARVLEHCGRRADEAAGAAPTSASWCTVSAPVRRPLTGEIRHSSPAPQPAFRRVPRCAAHRRAFLPPSRVCRSPWPGPGAVLSAGAG